MPVYKRDGRTQLWCRGSIAGQAYKCSTGVATGEPDAYQKAEEFEHTLRGRLWREHKLGDKGAVSVRDAAHRWLKTVISKTRHEDQSKIDWFLEKIPDLANLPISAVDVELNEVLQQRLLAQELAPGTVDKYMSVWRRFLRKCALDWQMMPAPPKVPMLNAPTKEPRWLTPSEFQRLFAALSPNHKPAALFAVNTGLRMRAMLSLKWRNVDIPNRRAWIEKQFMKAGRTHGFPLNDEAVRALEMARALRAEQEQDYLRRCARLRKSFEPADIESDDIEAGDVDHVFTYRRKPLDDCNTAAYQEALRKAQITDADWHTLRHTFASWAVQARVSLQELMKLGPWESYDMVLVYAHLAPDDLSEAVTRVARFGNQTNIVETVDNPESAAI